MSFSGTFHLGGDIHPKAVSRFYSNVRCLKEDVGKGLPLDAVRWDSRRLPLHEASVDVIVTDMVRYYSNTTIENSGFELVLQRFIFMSYLFHMTGILGLRNLLILILISAFWSTSWK